MLPEPVVAFLTRAAKDARTELPAPDASLFRAGVLDSFSLVEFVSLLESECGITVRDSELRPEHFDTIAKVEAFVSRAAGGR
jgi:acyl carrier protein